MDEFIENPISALYSKFYPRNITHMHPKGTSFGAPTGKFFAGLDLGLSMNPLKAQLVADSSTVRRLLASLSIDRKAD
jgi:hypothetical protein